MIRAALVEHPLATFLAAYAVAMVHALFGPATD